MTSVSMLAKLKVFATKKPLVKGMIAYSIMWPTGSIVQQTLEGRNYENYDWKRCLRFSLYGGFFVAPTLYSWVRLTSVMWPRTNLKSGVIKALVDQLSYGPFAMTSFYLGMSLLEGKTLSEAFEELRKKFWPTYKVGICIWPILQTINFTFVPERNRVVFVSVCSLMWTTFLAYMKQLESLENKANEAILQSTLEDNREIKPTKALSYDTQLSSGSIVQESL